MTILQHVTALQCTEPGIVSVSSLSICLHPATAVRVNTKASAPVSSVELCGVELAGVPTAFQHLQGFMWALADAMAELWILDLGDAHRLRKVTAGIPLTIGHFMCLASDPEADAGTHHSAFAAFVNAMSASAMNASALIALDTSTLVCWVPAYHQDQSLRSAYILTQAAFLCSCGHYTVLLENSRHMSSYKSPHLSLKIVPFADSPIQLFLGSRTDTSQLLSIPRALIQGQAQHAGASQHADPAEGSSQQLLEADSVQRLPAFDCAAPIHDAFVFQDPPGRAGGPTSFYMSRATCSQFGGSLLLWH